MSVRSVKSLALRSLTTQRIVIGGALSPFVRYTASRQPYPVASKSRLLSTSSPRYKEDLSTSQAPLGKVEPKLSLTFTCAVTDCGHRSSHEFSKRSYEKGIVIVQCPACKNRHLIADHLSWFTETESDPKNIEQIIASKGGKVQRGINYVDGQGYETMEIYKDDS